MTDEREGLCYQCGSPACFLIYIAGEDEKPHEEFACAEHSRGHWRSAILEPASNRTVPISLDSW
jgi:hypothetical protein